MTTITVNETTGYQLPSHWNELTLTQLYYVVTQLQKLDSSDTEAQAAIKTDIALYLSGLKLPDVAKSESDLFLLNQLRTKLLPAVGFLFEQNLLSKQLLPQLRIRKGFLLKYFYGPSDNFMNVSFGEFDDAEYFFELITKQNELTEERIKEMNDALNMLCAILYRPFEEKKGDTRIDYNAHDNAERVEWFKRADPEQKAAILFWYIGCRNQLVHDFSPLFNSPSGKASERSATWTMLAHSLAGPVLGDVDKVNSRPVRQVFTEMLRLFIQAEEMQANAPEVG